MGRTSRERRRRRKNALKILVADETDVINDMENWMLSLDWFPTCKLTPRIFPTTGRGLMCLDDVKANDILVKIPKELLITTSAAEDSLIREIFQSGDSYEAQCILAVYLAYEKHLGRYSRWKSYLNSLPSSYTTPDFCSPREKEFLSIFSRDLHIQSNKVESNYRSVAESINRLRKSNRDSCPHCGKSLRVILTFKIFKWAYYTVNTRAVYIDDAKTLNKFIKVKDANNMALAPFLDLFNHSYHGAVQASLVFDDEREFYQLKTLKPFPRGAQVFINYGSHDNCKLFMEYGFFIPDNPLDQVFFDLRHVERVASITRLSREFVVSNAFHKNMGFTSEGLTYNAKIVLFVLTTRCTVDEWKMKVYNATFSREDLLRINSLGMKILDSRMAELVEELNIMEKVVAGTESFEIAKGLVKEYVNLLNRSFEQLSANNIKAYM